MRLVVALTLFVASTAAATADDALQFQAVPQAAFPDVVVIGDGWPADMTDGYLDRHECDATKAGIKVAPLAPSSSSISSAPPSSGQAPPTSDIPKAAGGKTANR